VTDHLARQSPCCYDPVRLPFLPLTVISAVASMPACDHQLATILTWHNARPFFFTPTF